MSREAVLLRALRSIAANTCCDRCQEAALVARAALREWDNGGPIPLTNAQIMSLETGSPGKPMGTLDDVAGSITETGFS
jgi:hypothetical protein